MIRFDPTEAEECCDLLWVKTKFCQLTRKVLMHLEDFLAVYVVTDIRPANDLADGGLQKAVVHHALIGNSEKRLAVRVHNVSYTAVSHRYGSLIRRPASRRPIRHISWRTRA
jgi:hypothetical protein